ncbi:uncharacterized protein [Coffea arabica]|uniref:Rab-GAP TBC domain-containing protein n=1 Tax=Coffea arabica TaxID=13443 RepID=A0ABM4UT55_COFAR|nr:ecotropic viral integration site 5 protein homolog isoform X1 [Coffea arabica]
MTLNASHFVANFEPKRDAYGFTVRPQHLHRYREYSTIYKEEEEERFHKWNCFLQQQTESTVSPENVKTVKPEVTEQQIKPIQQLTAEGDASGGVESVPDILEETDAEKEVPAIIPKESSEVHKWVPVRPSLCHIEDMMSSRAKKGKSMIDELITTDHNHLPSIMEESHSGEELEQAHEEEHYDSKRDASPDAPKERGASINGVCTEPLFPWKELEFLVHGGVPRDLRGEVWQAFVGVRTRRVERYYQDLLAPETDAGKDRDGDKSQSLEDRKGPNENSVHVPESLRKQIEKDLTRTFPGHPALNENGRNSLRRLLLAYARHNPSVGYCQAMNFFAGLLLLMMPEENAFWTLVGIIDDYFDGYYSQEMIECQVDQLLFEELMRERFPKLVNHLDYLGVQVTWISGPWFLSIFVNMLPWESVLRVWDVLLFEGNRVMLFRTALALMELYGPVIVTTKDAADAISLLQSLAGSTFDSSQLVLTACMGFLSVTEDRLQGLREKHRPAVLAAVEERSKGARVWKDPKGLATKLYSFKHKPESLIKDPRVEEASGDKLIGGDVSHSESHATTDLNELLDGLNIDSEVDSLPDLQEQVVWMKVELCRLLEEKRTAILRAEELETALMEMVKQDNRRQLSARVEQLEREVADLQQALSDKTEQENAMIQVLMRVEQEQKVTEDARILAEQDAAAQRYAVEVLQEKHNKALASIAEMEKRVVMAESMLEATLQYESGQVKALASPGSVRPDSPRDMPRRTGLLPFGLGWRDRNKDA